MVAIQGNSGSWKTTFLNMIGLIEDFQSWENKIDGQKVPPINSRQGILLLRNTITFLFQNYALIEDERVKSNLEIALIYLNYSKEEKIEIINKTLALVGLNGYENKKIYEISGGEQQRIALARTLLKPSKIILADELTGSLDEENRDEIIRLLKILNNEGKTILIVTPDKVVADRCEKIYFINNCQVTLDDSKCK